MVGEKLVDIMLTAGRESIPESEMTNIVFGIVKSVNPMRIQVANEPKLVLSDTFLKLSPLCIAKEIEIPSMATSETEEHIHWTSKQTIQLWRGLAVNDRVLMLRVKGGNLYYVLQREGKY